MDEAVDDSLNDYADGLLARIEQYYDAVPRTAAHPEDHGSLTLFLRKGTGWPYYARPRLGSDRPVTVADVDAVRERQRRLGVPESFEWVDEVTPSLTDAAERSGLVVHAHPLMVLDREAWRTVPPPEGVTVRLVTADDPGLAAALAVSTVAFGEPGTAIGRAGRDELAAAVTQTDGGRLASTRERLRVGLTVLAAAYDETGPLSAGMHQPVGDTTEIVGVGTLPQARRRGLGVAVTSALVEHAVRDGATLVFLSAGDDAVARVYHRAGFRRVGTAMIADAPGH